MYFENIYHASGRTARYMDRLIIANSSKMNKRSSQKAKTVLHLLVCDQYNFSLILVLELNINLPWILVQISINIS